MSIPHCDYFATHQCRSCVFIEMAYPDQLSQKEQRSRALLPQVDDGQWLPSVEGASRDFRNRAKLVVGGTAGDVTLGILGPDGTGVDLRACLIHEPAVRAAIPRIAEFLNETGLAPYSVPKRRGELKFAHILAAPSGHLMVRFVVRSTRAADRVRASLKRLRELVPHAVLISVNLLPEHKAVLEGDHEEILLGDALSVDLEVLAPLHLLPQSFFQTNSRVAAELYRQAASWVEREAPRSLWDLYCGVGGFALSCSDASRQVLGIEISEAAVRSASRSACEAGSAAQFIASDATEFVLRSQPAETPEAVIVNPPRRGIGADLAHWLNDSGVRHVVYSSCNPESLARDLRAMPLFSVREARLFDMFPHTQHVEVMVLLERD